MALETKKVSFKDKRGIILDIVEKEPFEYATLITMKKGSVRANHYHKKTIQWAFVLKGKLRVLTRYGKKPVKSGIAGPFTLVKNAANEQHAFVALTDSEFLVLTRGPRGGQDYEKDTFRLAPEDRLDVLAAAGKRRHG
jgi:quercetin dioxygenase-like cupin family protein